LPWVLNYYLVEALTLIVCTILDITEILFPVLMIPIAGDAIDIAGITFSAYFFGWIGAISLLEIIPGLDMFPIFTTTWLIWYLMKRRRVEKRREEELEGWR
jgi:hypothetical protein